MFVLTDFKMSSANIYNLFCHRRTIATPVFIFFILETLSHLKSTCLYNTPMLLGWGLFQLCKIEQCNCFFFKEIFSNPSPISFLLEFNIANLDLSYFQISEYRIAALGEEICLDFRLKCHTERWSSIITTFPSVDQLSINIPLTKNHQHW